MKITDVEVIKFRTPTREHRTRWGKERWGEEIDAMSSITKISTDEGVSGYMEGGSRAIIEGTVKPLLLGENPLEREKLWGWMDQMTTSRAKLTERDMGVVDCALWDLVGRMTGMPVHKLLGGARERVKAYAVSASNLGPPGGLRGARHRLQGGRLQGIQDPRLHLLGPAQVGARPTAARLPQRGR